MEKQNEYNEKHKGAKDYERQMQKLDEEVDSILVRNNKLETEEIPDLKAKYEDFNKKFKEGQGKHDDAVKKRDQLEKNQPFISQYKPKFGVQGEG